MADSNENDPRPWTYTAKVRDVCARYGRSSNTVYSWLNSDDPPPHRKVGGEYRFDLAEVDKWFARRTAAADGVKRRASGS